MSIAYREKLEIVPKEKLFARTPDRTGAADQSFKEEADINNIVGRYIRTGVFDWESKHQPRWGDATQVPDYHQAMTVIADARSAFGELPSDIREMFNNEPGEMLAFISDAANRERAIELGMIPPDPVVPVSSPAAPAPAVDPPPA